MAEGFLQTGNIWWGKGSTKSNQYETNILQLLHDIWVGVWLRNNKHESWLIGGYLQAFYPWIYSQYSNFECLIAFIEWLLQNKNVKNKNFLLGKFMFHHSVWRYDINHNRFRKWIVLWCTFNHFMFINSSENRISVFLLWASHVWQGFGQAGYFMRKSEFMFPYCTCKRKMNWVL